MKTDSLFYRLFQRFPTLFFRLIQKQVPSCDYTGWSITLKQLEHRMDLLMLPEDPKSPIYSSEFQGYYEKNFYLRFLRESFQLLDEYDLISGKWELVVIFVKKEYDPGWEKWRKKLKIAEDFPMKVLHLDQLSKKFWKNALVPLKFLQVFFFKSKEDLQKNIPELSQELKKQKGINEKDQEDWFNFLVNVIVARFHDLSREEVSQMLSLHTIEDSQFYKDVIAIGKKEGKKEGEKKGIKKGELELLKRLLSQGLLSPETAEPQIAKLQKELKAMKTK